MNFMMEPKKGVKWPKDLPRFKSRQEAIIVCKELCKEQFIHRSEKIGKGQLDVSSGMILCVKNLLNLLYQPLGFPDLNCPPFLHTYKISRNRDFDESGLFTWIYEGDKSFSHLMTSILIGGFLFCVCFPIWPNFLKVFAWYMSVSLLIFIFFLVTFRGLLFLFIWILGYDCWFLPNLFDESLGFVDSFKPIISFEKTKEGQLMYRVGIAVAFFSFCWWAVTQPSEFDGFIAAQGDFIKDLYEGKLLADVSQTDKENIDKPKMESLEDLLKTLDSSDDEDEDELSEEERLEEMMDRLADEEEFLTDEE